MRLKDGLLAPVRLSERAVAALEERLVGLEHAMAGIVGRIGEIQDTLDVLLEDVEHVPGIPAGDETRSPLDRARDALGANEPDTP